MEVLFNFIVTLIRSLLKRQDEAPKPIEKPPEKPAPPIPEPIPAPMPKEPGDLPWMKFAKSQLGVKEPDPVIKKYHEAARFNADFNESWCSSFVCWCFEQCGIESVRDPGAREWLEWGEVLDAPIYGCVVVYWRGEKKGWKGHVHFYTGEDQKYNFGLGGNQGDAVRVALYPKAQVLGYRWPKGFPKP